MVNVYPALADVTDPTYVYTGAFVDELQRAGTHHAVVCPGSRSTPLALMLAAHDGIKVWMHVDERSAAFFGLGLAKRLGQPVALLCTSGTAAANFLPAVVEAKLTQVPLLVLTADRPPELRDCGAPQAIDQNRLYGVHVKWFVEVALPEATNAALRYIRTLANRAVATAQSLPSGPVHLNMPFREPLVPAPSDAGPLLPQAERDPFAWYGRPNNMPYIEITTAVASIPDQGQVTSLLERLKSTSRGLIVVGPYANTTLAKPLLTLARRLGYPVLADPLSQLRSMDHALALSSYDAFLRTETFIESTSPELVIRFGAMPTSKPLLLYLQHYPSCPHIVINSTDTWQEPTQLASEMIYVDAVTLCQNLLDRLVEQSFQRSDELPWIRTWLQADQVTRQSLHATMQDFPGLFEGRIFSELAAILPHDTTLYVGNSMPVRDLDTFFWSGAQPIHIIGNRGANGIDGVISSALGASAAMHKQAPTVLVIGDLSFFHDLNGLLAARLHQLDLTVVLVNNDGGGIFSFLPQAAYPEHFEQLFGTPIGLDFRPVVHMYGGTLKRIKDWEEFRLAIRQGISEGGLHIVEVKTERTSNVTMHRQLWQAVDVALRRQLYRRDES